MALVSMWAVLELQPGVTMGSLECRVAPQLSVVREPCSILSCPSSLATTPLSCFELTLSMGMASLGPAGLKKSWVVPQPVFHMLTAPGRRTRGLRSSLKAQAAPVSQRLHVRNWRGELKRSSRSLRH